MNEITNEEKDEVRQILKKFYRNMSNSQIDNWDITQETYAILGEMISASEKCTRAMHLVPRPGVPANPLSYASKHVRNSLRRFLMSDEGKHYITCMTATANNFRRRFDLAGNGL